MPHNFVYKKGFSSEGALRSGTEKRPGMGRQPDKRKKTDAAEGQSERSNEAEAGTPESTTAGSVWNPAVPPEWRKSHSSKKKEEWHNFRL